MSATRIEFEALAPILKQLFGKPSRAMFAVWVLNGHSTFYTLQAQRAMESIGIAHSVTTSDLAALVKTGLLTRTSVGGRVYYTKTDADFWAPFAELDRTMASHLASTRLEWSLGESNP